MKRPLWEPAVIMCRHFGIKKRGIRLPRPYYVLSALTVIVILALTVGRADAHQPFFEDRDHTLAQPYPISDPTVSTALYATLQGPADVDYFTFPGRTDQEVLIEMVIPQIVGQKKFAPTVALLGPGLPAGDLPDKVARPAGAGVRILGPKPGKAPTFFEPYTRTSYWRRQSARITLPADGTYWVAVYHPGGAAGRYVLSLGDREIRGGDPESALKLRKFFTPLRQPPSI